MTVFDNERFNKIKCYESTWNDCKICIILFYYVLFLTMSLLFDN